MVDYLNELRESCLEAYTGVVQGLKGEDEKNISREYLLLSTSLNLLNLLLYYLWKNALCRYQFHPKPSLRDKPPRRDLKGAKPHLGTEQGVKSPTLGT